MKPEMTVSWLPDNVGAQIEGIVFAAYTNVHACVTHPVGWAHWWSNWVSARLENVAAPAGTASLQMKRVEGSEVILALKSRKVGVETQVQFGLVGGTAFGKFSGALRCRPAAGGSSWVNMSLEVEPGSVDYGPDKLRFLKTTLEEYMGCFVSHEGLQQVAEEADPDAIVGQELVPVA